jgi:Flp pilus assembly protein TadG
LSSPHTFGGVIAPPCESAASRAPSYPTRVSRRRAKSRGQSIAEFALILPVMLAFVGLTIDFARVFQVWITLESAVRDAAESVATDTTVTNTNDALTLAKRTICIQAQNVPGFTRSGQASPNDVYACTAPQVTVTSFSMSTDPAVGASTTYPLGTATIRAQLPFSPLLAYPFLTQNGTWTVSTESSFSILRGRS